MEVKKSSFTGKKGSALGKCIVAFIWVLIGFVALAGCIFAGAYAVGVVLNGLESPLDVIKMPEFQMMDIIVLAASALVGIIFMLLFFAAAAKTITKWKITNTYLNGYKLSFDGKVGQLWFKLIGWTFLTIITLTIYGWWNWVRYRKWVIKHTYSEELMYVAEDPYASYYNYTPAK
jgi:hypothetical protein